MDNEMTTRALDEKDVSRALALLRRYKEGKANLERKIVENELWYKLRHWECMRSAKDDVQPVSGWLFNSIAGKHADAMDNIPAPVVLPREQGDVGEAQMLSSILPVILEQNDFEQLYSDVWDYKLKTGTGVYGVFFDPAASGGLGDICLRKIDVLNLFWEPGVQDIRDSRNLFHVSLQDNEALLAAYPELEGRMPGDALGVTHYVYDDKVDTSDKSVVVDWYYKKPRATGGSVLHYAKLVGDTLLYASENDPERCEKGWYAHGEYPFVFDTLYRAEGTPCGFGFIDVAKDAQAFIDRGNQALLKNMLAGAAPRFFIKESGGVNEEEFADLARDFVHVSGGVNEDNIRPVDVRTLSPVYVSLINNKIDELKEVTGNRDVSAGGTAGGVTAASAIAAMQEAGSKLSRDNNRASHRAFRRICLQIIELIREFYDLPRCFRIVGEDGADQFLTYSNEHLRPRHQGMAFGVDMGYRLPLFDVQVTSQKASPYSRLSQNELALQFFGAGFFDPARAEQALACLDMMDFDRKDGVMRAVTRARDAYAAGATGSVAPLTKLPDSLVGQGKESKLTKKARERVANGPTPT